MNSIKHIIPKLTAEEKELVRDVLEKEDRSLWIDRLALAPSAGLGIRMSQSTLYRLKQQLELEENLSDRDSIKEQARAVANEEQNATLESPAIKFFLVNHAFSCITQTFVVPTSIHL